MQKNLSTAHEEEFNPVELQTYPEILEKKLLKLLEHELGTHTYLTFEQVLESADTREVFTGTYEYFTNPHSVITPKHLQSLYQFLYSIEFEWHPLSDEANNWDSEWSEVSNSTDQLRPEGWRFYVQNVGKQSQLPGAYAHR